jgi:hypothetical protein
MLKVAKAATITIAVDKFMTPPTLLEYGDRNADPSLADTEFSEPRVFNSHVPDQSTTLCSLG